VRKKEYFVKLSAKYPPATRALLGVLLEELGSKKELEALKKMLNPITKYEFKDLSDTLHSCTNWNTI